MTDLEVEFSKGSFVRSKDQLSCELDGEVVSLSVSKGSYFRMDTVGGAIWELIAMPQTVEEICDRLLESFEVDRLVCERDVTVFLAELLEAGLVERLD